MSHQIILSASAGRYVSKLSNLIRRHLMLPATRHDITAKEGFTLLFIIAQVSEGHNVYQKDIEEEYSLRPATATLLLQRMERSGLIRRVPDPSDSRLKRILVADKALAYQDQLTKDMLAMEEKLVNGIAPEKLDVFFEVMEQMLQNMKI